MEPLRRLASFWSWLPSFRAVAETEHLPTAGEALLVSAPALSRAVKLLERDLGVSLFRRSGRNLVLTREGERLLVATRLAMRTLHEVATGLASPDLRGPVHVMSAGAVTSAYVLPALADLRREHPEFRPVVTTSDRDLVPRLLRGRLDLVLQSRPLSHPELTTVHLGNLTSGVFCGPGHPLARKRRVSMDTVLQQAFVGPPPDDHGHVADGWPAHLPRRFGMHVDQMRIGREVCATTDLLAVLPDVMAKDDSGPAGLRRLPLDAPLPVTDIYATHRPAVGDHDAATMVLTAVEATIRGGGGA